MPNEKHLSILKQGVKEWNAWRTDHPHLSPDLRRANLRDSRLEGADLKSADLSYAKLRNANLSEANLTGANLSHTRCQGADFTQANLTDSKLTDSQLENCCFHATTMIRANLSREDRNFGVIATAADFSNADLSQTNLSNVILSRANLTNANLADADIRRAVLYETVFANTNLRTTRHLDACTFRGPSTIDHRTLQRSGKLPQSFLRGCGFPEQLIASLPSLINESVEFYSCFISYNHHDRKFALRLHEKLQVHGIRCWLDEHQLLPGDPIYEQIDHGINNWDKVLLCCSINSLTSWWVDNEVETAFEKERQLMRDRGTKIPVLIPMKLDGYMLSAEC